SGISLTQIMPPCNARPTESWRSSIAYDVSGSFLTYPRVLRTVSYRGGSELVCEVHDAPSSVPLSEVLFFRCSQSPPFPCDGELVGSMSADSPRSRDIRMCSKSCQSKHSRTRCSPGSPNQ